MFGNISQLLEMKKKAEELKAKMETITVSESFKGITVDSNGNRKILSIHIDPLRINDKHELESDLVHTVNLALQSAEKAALSDMSALSNLAEMFKK